MSGAVKKFDIDLEYEEFCLLECNWLYSLKVLLLCQVELLFFKPQQIQSSESNIQWSKYLIQGIVVGVF
jgi:hypothetical protein